MTAAQTHPATVGPANAPCGSRWLRRVGGVAVTGALIVLGLGTGLWLGSPASAATGPLQVKMAGDSAYSTSTAAPLLSVAGLSPGGSVSGSMDVLDDSDNAAGSGMTDSITLRMVDLAMADGVAGGPIHHGSGAALKRALRFTLAVTGSAGAIPSLGTLAVTDLIGGVTLATGLVSGNELHVSATAFLPSGVGNTVQYGQVSFNLSLGLTSTNGHRSEPSRGGNGNGGVGNDQSGLEVQGASRALSPDKAAPQASGPADSNALVLGQGAAALPNTGVPVTFLLSLGASVLLAGLALLYAGRRLASR